MASKILRSFMQLKRPTTLMTSSRKYSSNVPEGLWKLGRLNHVAIATPDLPRSVSLYRDIMGATVRYI